MLIECAGDEKIDFSCHILEHPKIINYAKQFLPNVGVLKYEESVPYCYLKLDDNYIHQLFPLLQELQLNKGEQLHKPDYFSEEKHNVGAHISLVYPEEIGAIKLKNEVKQHIAEQPQPTYTFNLNALFSVSIFNQTFYALTVSCPALEKMRMQHGFTKKLNYQGLLLPLHITLAVAL